MNLKETYNKIAEDWVLDHNDDDWWQAGTDYFLSLLPKGASVLDVGCGGGIKTQYISAKGHDVTGIDFSEKMIEIARRENQGVKFAVIDMYDIDKIEKNYDGIFAQAALLHIPKTRALEVLTKMKDKLNKDGLLYLAVKGIRDDGAEEDIIKGNEYGYEYERFFSYFKLEELKAYFEQLGLLVVWEENKKSNKTNWIQIIGKKT